MRYFLIFIRVLLLTAAFVISVTGVVDEDNIKWQIAYSFLSLYSFIYLIHTISQLCNL